jgi:hypothetical protein
VIVPQIGGALMAPIIKDKELKKVAENVKPDTKMRVHLPKILVRKGITYHIYTNNFGVIVLEPQVTIPASEAWLFEDKDTLALLDKSMIESAKGQVINRGSFAKYK